MKWVNLAGVHVNMDQVMCFSWRDKGLMVNFYGYSGSYTIRDPDKQLYLKMCRSQGIRPAEEVVSNGD